MVGRRVGHRVDIADARIVVVARIGVAAVAVRRARRDRLVVVAAHDADVVRAQQRHHARRMRPEAAEVAEAANRLGTPRPGVGERRLEREIVAVDAAQERHAAGPQKFLHAIPVA